MVDIIQHHQGPVWRLIVSAMEVDAASHAHGATWRCRQATNCSVIGPMSIKWTPGIETLTGSCMICRISLGCGLIMQDSRDPLPIIDNFDSGKDRDFRFAD